MENIHASVSPRGKKLFLPLVFLVVLFVVPLFTNGQLFGDDLVIEVDPVFPGAHEEVRLTATSFSTDLNRSNIFWYVNDTLIKKGVGEKRFVWRTRDVGTTDVVDLIVIDPQGTRLTQSTVFRPADVDVVWQAHTFTPPLYKGKALPSPKSLIEITALPEFRQSNVALLSPGKMIYTWEQDGVRLGRLSGFGKDSIVIQAPRTIRGKTSITVRVSSFDNKLQAHKTISIRAQAPEILFYENHPLEGVRHEKALADQFALLEKEMVLRAEPYYFSLDDIQNDNMLYTWKVNGKDTPPTSQNKKDLTLRQEGDQGGVAIVSLDIENIERLLQFAEKSLRIQFGFGTPFNQN